MKEGARLTGTCPQCSKSYRLGCVKCPYCGNIDIEQPTRKEQGRSDWKVWIAGVMAIVSAIGPIPFAPANTPVYVGLLGAFMIWYVFFWFGEVLYDWIAERKRRK